MYQQVTLYPNNMKGTQLDCVFRSENTFNRFMDDYAYFGGYLQIVADLIQEYSTNEFNLPVIPANSRGFKQVRLALQI